MAESNRELAGAHTVVFTADDRRRTVRPPEAFLPRMFYFENTYLGGSAAYAERLRRLDRSAAGGRRGPTRRAGAAATPSTRRRTEGSGSPRASTATHFEGPGSGSSCRSACRAASRYGWRRPPLDIVLVVDQPAFTRGPTFVTGFVVDLLRQLGPRGSARDRARRCDGADVPRPVAPQCGAAAPRQSHRPARGAAPQSPRDLADAMQKAGVILDAAAEDEARIPGTKTLLVLAGEPDQGRIAEAARAAHELTVQGCVTSVFALNAEQSEWWQVANAGFGNLHRITDTQFAPAIDEELAEPRARRRPPRAGQRPPGQGGHGDPRAGQPRARGGARSSRSRRASWRPTSTSRNRSASRPIAARTTMASRR